MFCKNCGTEMEAGAQACPQCGTQAISVAPATIPEQYRPLSPWAYFGLQILFSLPIIGFIFLLVFTFNGSNINRRNFTRSYWCGFLLFLIVIAVICALAAAQGSSISALLNNF